MKLTKPFGRTLHMLSTAPQDIDPADQDDEATGTDENTVVELTVDQWNQLCALAGVDTDTTPDAAIEALGGLLADQDDAHSLTVRVDRGTLTELQSAAAYGMQAKAKEQDAERVAFVEDAIKRHKISSAGRDMWIKRMRADEDVTRKMLSEIPDETFPVVEIGHNAPVDDDYSPSWVR
ncbi:hypothetical protein M0E87_06915 [Corynebacterium sp. CCM 9185]|uniref:Uncharacterized protein n=1 Tax=Corynebacterium marambiense TaxID=2765364 RepID=A0ABS0VUK0_9CORY|nr:hypothetical protein [Corynebacterium marambiense]MBI9000036.1 hypothetical protein [Corynebacterium marambiense]MCK7663388.1 hypothetical protein [Corynebacterium marambiense]